MITAVTIKRWQVFCREKRQWLLTFSPFINIINLVFIIEGYKKLIVTSRHFDNVESVDEQLDKQSGFRVRGDVLMDVAIGFSFPLIMNYGFSSCAGMFMLMPLEDREMRTKQILTMSGLTSFRYYVGLILADLVLYFPPLFVMMAYIEFFRIRVYYDQLDQFLGLFIAFGPLLISTTYAFS